MKYFSLFHINTAVFLNYQKPTVLFIILLKHHHRKTATVKQIMVGMN